MLIRTIVKKDFVVPKRNPNSHKGQNGKVLVVGGSEDYIGAPALAGLAALRCGCDIATVAAPEKTAWAINTLSPDLMTRKLKGKYLAFSHYKEIVALAIHFDVLLVGNGAGLRPDTQKLIRALAKLPMQKVIDADGVKAIRASDPVNAIVTPNKKELKIFLANSRTPYTEDPSTLQRTLRRFFANGNVLVVKGKTDIIISAHSIARNTTGNAGMTKGGTGDVLAGLSAGYYAQLHDAMAAAKDAAYMNGLIGDLLLKKKRGFTYLASDIVDELGRLRGK